jgi:hypothetical protein
MESKLPKRSNLNHVTITEKMSNFLLAYFADENVIDICTIERL